MSTTHSPDRSPAPDDLPTYADTVRALADRVNGKLEEMTGDSEAERALNRKFFRIKIPHSRWSRAVVLTVRPDMVECPCCGRYEKDVAKDERSTYA